LPTLDTEFYISKKFGYQIAPPKGWAIAEADTYLSIKNSLVDKNSKGNFVANMNIVSENATTQDLTAYVAASKSALSQSLTNYSLIDDRDVVAGSVQAHILGGTFTQGDNSLRNMQLAMIVSGKAYVVTATSLAGAWDGYKDVFEKSLLTFKVN